MADDGAINKGYTMRPIEEIAERAGIPAEYLEKYGAYKAKILWPGPVDDLPQKGKLVMVTAMTPTPAGEGKTTTAIGLADAFGHLGKKAIAAVREPSLGPAFGLKGGATGGGRAQIAPRNDINLHFTGDIHAVTAAHNLLAAMVDNRLHFDGVCGLIDCRTITWKRVLDMDDRVLREVVVGIGGPLRGIAVAGFDITAASEVGHPYLSDLQGSRRGSVVIGYGQDAKRFARRLRLRAPWPRSSRTP
jgi:formate--tetrahydrofolate ligase